MFFEKNGVLYTPQRGNILAGITRETIITLCNELQIHVHVGLYNPELLENADGAFLCGTAAEVIGVHSINKKIFTKKWEDTIGKKLQIAYKNLVLEKKLTESN